jgi:hypothetical protein
MQRPTSVTVFGVLNIMFAALGIGGALASMLLMMVPANGSNNPVIQVLHNSPAYLAWMEVSIVLGLVASVSLLAAGIGLLNLWPWARILSIAYAIYAIGMIPVGMVGNLFFLVQPMLEQAHQRHGPEAAAAIGGLIGGTFGGCFGLIYPVLLLIFMLRANVVAAFRKPVLPTGQP